MTNFDNFLNEKYSGSMAQLVCEACEDCDECPILKHFNRRVCITDWSEADLWLLEEYKRPETPEERIESLEKMVATLEEENKRLKREIEAKITF